MKRFFCCLKAQGESSSSNAEKITHPDPPELQLQSARYATEDDAPSGSGDSNPLNSTWTKAHEIPDDREYGCTDPATDIIYPTNPPLPANCGESFPWHEISDGAKKFQKTNYLGRGSYGEVYRCDLKRANLVGAAKIQDPKNPDAHLEFIAEVTTLHNADHPNVIKLLGKCYGRRHRALVYELMLNGSLEKNLCVKPRRGQELPKVMDWDTRMGIALGLAEGLVYVHEELKAIHRDLKATNILLDENYVAKLNDFGLATRIVVDGDGVEQPIVIKPVKGSPGYLSAEAEVFGRFSTKSDVYAYGVLLIQLVTGRKAVDGEMPFSKQRLTDWINAAWNVKEYTPSMVIDARLEDRYSVEGLNKIFEAARKCIAPEAASRPDMRKVETMVRQAAAFPLPAPPVTESHSK